MPTKVQVNTKNAPPPAPFLSQAIIVNDIVYCSGQLGVSPKTGKMVEGSIKERTVSELFFFFFFFYTNFLY